MSLSGNKAPGGIEVVAEYLVRSTDWGGIQPALPSVASHATGSINVTVSRDFKPILGALTRTQGTTQKYRIIVVKPTNQADPAGLSFVSATWNAPATPFASGGRPTVTLTWMNDSAGALTPTSQEFRILLINEQP